MPTFTQLSAGVTVAEGGVVTAAAKVKASSRTAVSEFVMACRDSAGKEVDFPRLLGVTISRSGTVVEKSRTYPSGTYSYWPAVLYRGRWYDTGPKHSFTVQAPPVGVPTDPEIPTVPTVPTVPSVPSTPVPTPPTPTPDGPWTRVFTDTFDTPAAEGEFLKKYPTWGAYDGFPDTSKRGTYEADMLSVVDGMLRLHLKTVGGKPLVSAPVPNNWAGQVCGRYTVRFRADAGLAGFKTAWLLWPNSDNWAEGEVDFPEGALDGTIGGFNHVVGNPSHNSAWASTSARYTEWHTAVIEWTPGKVVFLLDGVVVMTDTKNVPTKPMRWTLQTETNLSGPAPAASVDGYVYIDSVSIDRYTP